MREKKWPFTDQFRLDISKKKKRKPVGTKDDYFFFRFSHALNSKMLKMFIAHIIDYEGREKVDAVALASVLVLLFFVSLPSN